MRKLMTLLTAILVVAVLGPADSTAQGRGRGQGQAVAAQKKKDKQAKANAKRDDESIYRVNDRRVRDRDDEWYENRRVRNDTWSTTMRGNGKGPSFCRSGAGHPVHGRQWCINKGFGLGSNSTWDRVRWEDVIFRRPQSRTNLEMGRDVLADVLGSVIFGRLDARRRSYGINEPLTGRWMNVDNRSVMLVNAGSYPLAELIDDNRDRRVDIVLVNFAR
jgi:hypothetical protein